MKQKNPTDEIALGPEVAPEQHLALRRKNGHVQEVLIRELKDGMPILGEAAMMGSSSCDCGHGHWRKVESLYKREGPAQVATLAYREGYDRIFGKVKVGVA